MEMIPDQRTARKNYWLYIFASTLRTVAFLCASGSLMQAFLLAVGLSDTQLYLHSTFYQAANVLTILLASRCADRGSIARRMALYNLPHILLFLGYLPFCFSSDSSELFWLLIMVGILQAIFAGVLTVFEYKIPYFIFAPKEYGSYLAIYGALAYAVQLLIGLLMNWLSTVYSYQFLMRIGFILAAALMLLAALAQWFMKSLVSANGEQTEGGEEKRGKSEEQVPYKEVFTHRVFFSLLPAHLLRGFAFGTTTVITIISASLGFGTDVINAMMWVQAAAMLLSSLAFGLIVRRYSARVPLVAGLILFLPILLLLVPNKYLFLATTFLVLFGRVLVDTAVPTLLLRAVPVRIAGPYNAFRMGVHFGGALIATSLATVISAEALLILTLVAKIGAVACYLFVKAMRE